MTGSLVHDPLVASFRSVEGKPRQRTRCTLGRLEPGSEVDTVMASLQRAQGITVPPSALDGLRFTVSRHAGDIWALSELWRSLGFDELALAWRRSKSEVNVLSCLRLMVMSCRARVRGAQIRH